ncbi:hypothetical protein ASG43_06090 [Aureimonas sp. Leaf454]|uniref:MobA/MobL family protein n=1 Tax=Aureimonas sp. Leaf454 TaxID=1736381 RepID=UPI0006F3BAD4|nr:MobA/MobL family protein [Aureimonas sp. Leaf454]KQT50829.1 hypothetical protein ASG43_06090 [Aureimonas sp. Leaf454]
MSDFFRVQLGIVSRSERHSAAKRSAYQACCIAIDHAGRRFDFSRKATEHAMPTVVLAPDGVPDWCLNPGALWNRAAAAEKRLDAQEARVVDFSMPRAIPRDLWAAAVRHVYQPFQAAGMVLQIDVHDTAASDGGRNVNVHAIGTLRRIDGNEFARKKERAWSDWFREREGRVVRELIAERLTTFCRTHGIAYMGDARPNADRGLPSPEPELPRWNAVATKRTGTLTPAIADLAQHRRRRRAWQAAAEECADAEAERKGLERPAREIAARRLEPAQASEGRRTPGDRRAAALRSWQGGGWLDVEAIGNVARVRVDPVRDCLWIDLADGSALLDTGTSIRLQGALTWVAAEETAAAAERHGWKAVRVFGDAAYGDAVAVACAMRGILVENHALSREAAALLKSKLAERLTTRPESAHLSVTNKDPGDSRAAYLSVVQRQRQTAAIRPPAYVDLDLPAPGPVYRPAGSSDPASRVCIGNNC